LPAAAAAAESRLLHPTPLLLMGSAVSENLAKANNSGTQGSTIDRSDAVKLNATVASKGTTAQKMSPRSWFALTFSFAFVVKTLCMMSNVLFQVSPIPQVRLFDKMGDTGEADAAPFISILYGGCQWCFYGFFAYVMTQKSGFLVLVYSNVAGAILGVYYILGFQRNCKNPESLRKLFMYYQAASTLAILQVLAMIVLPRERALFFCGFVSSVCSVLGACSLLATLPIVLKTRSSASINKTLLGVGMMSAVLWLTCGLLLRDAWIIVPNVFGLLLQSIVVGVVMHFPSDAGDEAGDLDDSGYPSEGLLTSAIGIRRGVSGPGPRVLDYGSLHLVGETGGTPEAAGKIPS